MKNFIRFTWCFLLFGLAVCPAQAAFSNLYIFGDALSATADPGAPGGSYFYGQRWSDGRVWVEVLAQRQGLGANSITNVNWSNSSNNNSYYDHNSAEVVTDVNNFTAPSDVTNDLFIVWVCNADAFDAASGPDNPAQWSAAINQAQTNHLQIITNLYAKGVRTLILPNVVDISKIPAFNAGSLTTVMHNGCVAYNVAFSNTINQARVLCPGLKIYVPDFFTLLNNVLTNAAYYGLTNALSSKGFSIDAYSTLSDLSLNGPGANYIFWDPQDPTAKLHEVMADTAQQLISPVMITSQPTNRTVVVGGTATFSVTAGGTPPLNYQWNFNGTNISGATNTTLVFTNVQFSQAGTYTVLVTNLFGSVLSSNAVLTVNGIPPFITTQPTNQTVVVGGTATFSVTAGGTPSPGYQWNFNGTNISGATNTTLVFTNVQFSQAGTYTVLVTNLFGSVLSSNAVLTVNPAGAAYVVITNPTPEAWDRFGYSVAGVGTNQFVIGAFGKTIGTNVDVGQAYLYNANGTLLATITNPAPAAYDYFGASVAGVGINQFVIGAYGKNIGANANAGQAYLYNTSGTLLATITNPAPGHYDFFGGSVAGVGTNQFLIGADGKTIGANVYAGQAYLYNTSGTLLAIITNPAPAVYDYFGGSVAGVGTNQFLIGAYGKTIGGNSEVGQAYLYNTSGTLLSIITNPAPAALDDFSWSVAGVGINQFVIGGGIGGGYEIEVGHAYLYNMSGPMPVTNPASTADGFGYSVAGVGINQFVIGAVSKTIGTNTYAGQAYLYNTNGTLLATITNPAPGYYDFFGLSVAGVGTNQFVIGACGKTIGGNSEVGHAYLYTITSLPMITTQQTSQSLSTANISVSSLGSSPSISGGKNVSFNITGSAGSQCAVYSSSDLKNWTFLGCVTLNASGTAPFTVSVISGMPQQFYRVVSQ